MKKIHTTTLVILLTAAAAFAQTKSEAALTKQLKSLKADKTFALVYDKDSDNSKIYGFSEDFGKQQTSRANLSNLRFGLAFFFQGKTLTAAPNEYVLTVQASGKKPRFADAHDLKFTIDAASLDLGDARYVGKSGVEYLNFKLTREQLGKLAKAKTVSMRVGDAEFNLSAEQMKMFADVFALSEPSAT